MELPTDSALSLRAELGEAYALLDVIFAHVPVGLALFDAELRYVRVNDRMAAIAGVPAAEHAGRSLADVLPGLPRAVEDDLRRVLDTGEPLIEVEVAGETPARPGRRREWLSSYWPVRAHGEQRITGIGAVVFEVTDRRAARRALRAQADRYEALLQALSDAGQGMVVIEEDGRCVHANAAFEQISGYTFPELCALDSLFELALPDDREEAVGRAVLRIERGWVDELYTLRIRRRDGRIALLEAAGVPLEAAGSPQLVVLVRDVTERHSAEVQRERLLARAALMAEASELFDQSLDEERTVRSVAELCVRDVAEACVIVLGEDPRGVRRIVHAGRDDVRRRAMVELGVRYPVEEDPDHPLLAPLRTGRPEIVEDPTRLLPRAADARQRELLRALRVGAAIAVPLRARGAVRGVLALGLHSLEGEDRDFLLAVLEDLGRRAALALDTARLYEERSAIARTLQRSLLPPALPDVPGLELAARYLPAGEGNEVGGDFYDCFPTGGGDWAAVIGDVCGKGAEAATVTALARHTTRAAALHDPQPRAVLHELNEAILRHSTDYRFCTALYVSLVPAPCGVDVCVGTGGHPPPFVVRADGRVEPAAHPGTLLGVLPTPRLSELRTHLKPGDALVLFTDGVIEASARDRARGPEELGVFLRGCAGRSAAEIAAAVEQRTLGVQSVSLRDDVAILVLRARPASFDPPEAGVATAT